MTALGQLCLDRGRRNALQVVSEQWVRRATSALVPIAHSDPFADAYGYMWYTKALDISGTPVRIHFASGNGGNKIYVIPDRNTVVAIASSAYGRPYGQRRSQQILRDILSQERA